MAQHADLKSWTHGVRSVHASTSPCTRTCIANDIKSLHVVNLSNGECPWRAISISMKEHSKRSNHKIQMHQKCLLIHLFPCPSKGNLNSQFRTSPFRQVPLFTDMPDARLNSSTINNDRWSIMTDCGDEAAWHVLVTPWYCDVGVVMLSLHF